MRTKAIAVLLLGFTLWSAANAQPATDNLLARASGNVAYVLANKAVQEELKMTEDEAGKVRVWTKEFRTKAEQIKKDKGADQVGNSAKGKITPLSAEETERIAAANSVIRKESYKELGDLLSKAQVERLKQIDLQFLGIDAFQDDEVSAELKLTDTQKTAFKKLREDVMKSIFDLINESIRSKISIDMAQEKIQKSLKDCCDKAVAMLSPVQMKKWQEMTGKPFDVEKLRFRSPRKKE